MQITSNKKFKKDLKNFQIKIEKIEDKKQKSYYSKILTEFLHKAKIIDETHSSHNAGKIQPNLIKENIKELNELRYQLQKLNV